MAAGEEVDLPGALRRSMRFHAALFAALVILAGCIDADRDTPDGPFGAATAITGTTTTATEARTWAACQQSHQHYDARAEDFAGDVPPGFSVVADAAGLTTLLIHITRCGEEAEGFLGVHVEPPAGLADPDRADVALLQLFATPDMLAAYSPAPRIVPASFRFSETAGLPDVQVDGGGESWQTTPVMVASSGPFAAEGWARWYADDERLWKVTADGAASTNAGFGVVVYRHSGPGGAPPATAGVIHAVTDLDWTLEVRP